jgi:hypothetical protein
MVAPITGPFTVVRGSSSTDEYMWARGFKQASPHTLVLSYERRGGTSTRKGNPLPSNELTWDFLATMSGSWTHLSNAAYDGLKNKIHDQANMAVNLAEMSQSYSMIRSRTLQLLKFGAAINRFDFLTAARTLRMSTVPKRVSVKRSASNNYLEYHFGWAPLIGDIHSAIDILQNPIKDHHVSVVTKDSLPTVYATPYSAGTNPSASGGNATAWESYRRYTMEKAFHMGVEVAVTNPNLHLANQMGLVNPAVFLYERIPFSFVADWFFNVEQCLSSFTDFYGLTLKNAWNTQVVKGTFASKNWSTSRYWSGTAWVSYVVADQQANSSFHHMKRSSGLINPVFSARPWKPWGMRRAAAAVSLLVQQLSKTK